jgi:4-hydroxy-tetrahydrodipicolinate synthase
MTGRFGAVVTAMVTPFREDHSLDLDAARGLAAHLFEHGTDSIVVAGSTGESPTLTHNEKLELFRAIVDVSRGNGRVICGTGTYDTAETLELSREAAELGADGLLLVTPYYNKPPQRISAASRTRWRCRSSSTTSPAERERASSTTRCSSSPSFRTSWP